MQNPVFPKPEIKPGDHLKIVLVAVICVLYLVAGYFALCTESSIDWILPASLGITLSIVSKKKGLFQ